MQLQQIINIIKKTVILYHISFYIIKTLILNFVITTKLSMKIMKLRLQRSCNFDHYVRGYATTFEFWQSGDFQNLWLWRSNTKVADFLETVKIKYLENTFVIR